MTILHQHFIEVKLRIFYIIFSTILTFLICYNSQIEIIYILSKPFLDLEQTFIFLKLTEAFYTLLKICTILTLLIIIPFFSYHVWCFFLPSFYKFERTSRNFFFFSFVFYLVQKFCSLILLFYLEFVIFCWVLK